MSSKQIPGASELDKSAHRAYAHAADKYAAGWYATGVLCARCGYELQSSYCEERLCSSDCPFYENDDSRQCEENLKFEALRVIESLHAQLAQQRSNEPLTLDELRGMGGEPVWVETMQEWRIVDIGVEKDIRLYSIRNTISAKHVFHNDGRIYRRKPERSEGNAQH